MRFGPVPVAEAAGAILAHSLALPSGRLRKGRVLDMHDCAALVAAGHGSITVARLEPGDIGENAAAARLAIAIAPDAAARHLRLGNAATGRVNVYATGTGVLTLDRAAFDALNAAHPTITVATLPPFALARAGQLVATVKIIAYGVAEADLARAEAAGARLALHPVALASAALIETQIAGGTTFDKGARAVADRVRTLGLRFAGATRVPHEADALAAALGDATADLILILTGSATSDADDTAPQAVRAAGGVVTRFGLPVDPGNLLFLGRIGPRPVIGLPGCARSPALNGADWVIWRVACGLDVTDADAAAMGVGGLLKESPARPHPREGQDAALPPG